MTTKSEMTQQALAQLDEIIGENFSLGSYLRSIRLSDEKAQVEFAQLLDISKQQLCDIEHNRKSISPKLAAEYAKKLGYSEEQFVRLAIQDMLDREHLNFAVKLIPLSIKLPQKSLNRNA